MLLIIHGLLCFSALVFPFSVAATNVGLGIALALGFVSGLWWMGAKQCWHKSATAPFVFLTAMAFIVDGMFGPTLEEHFSGHEGIVASPLKPVLFLLSVPRSSYRAIRYSILFFCYTDCTVVGHSCVRWWMLGQGRRIE